MKEFTNRPEFTPKCENEKASLAATAVLENWEPTTILCPKCGGKHTSFNTMCVLTTYPEQYQYICSDCGHRWTGFKAQSIGPMQSWPDLEFENITPIGQMGWICPKCGRVYSPTTSQCLFCGGTYSPNIVYCGPNNGTKDILDTVYTAKDVLDIIDTVNTAKNYPTQSTQPNNLKYESFKQQHGE